ncbi:putative S-locus lectin protein kinase family protein [Abeliophyllum distichum]|uniref:S-locus lectin protein kinase family protein n=1 Tax=Abeliophyllum distichum TaxID=126358 RepID=A0ABD1PBC0_9LAMI
MPRAKKPTQDAGPSSGKRKTPSKKTSKQVALYDDNKFETEEAWSVYKNDTSGRGIISERRVLISNFENEVLGQVIARNRWETFVATPRVAYVEIVKEFYANIHDNIDNPEHPQYHRVYMRGQYIPFSPLTILRYYGLENMETDVFEAANTNPDDVVISICQGIDHWPIGSSTLDYRNLLPQLQTKTLDIGNYIFANVRHIRGTRRCLAFPSLITGICELHGIDLSHEITTVKRTMQIDRIGIRSSELHMHRKQEQRTQGPIDGQGVLADDHASTHADPMAEDTTHTAAELHQWRTAHATLEAQIREIRDAQVQEAETQRREHEALSSQMTQLLRYFHLYPPPPPQ